MKSNISETTLRDRLTATLDRVSRGDELLIERRGRPVAALISAVKFNVIKGATRRRALAAMKQRRGGALNDAQVTELGLKAQRWARRKRRRTAPRRSI